MSQLRLRMPTSLFLRSIPFEILSFPKHMPGRFGVVTVIRRRANPPGYAAVLRYSQCPLRAYILFDIVMLRELMRSG